MRSRMRISLAPRQMLWIASSLIVIILIVLRLTTVNPDNSNNDQQQIITFINPTGEQQTIELEELVIGIVAAETPASFEPEALKAQAIAARTYVLSHTPPFGTPRHENASVCSDSACCQAYLSGQMLLERWGDNFSEYYDKIAGAVQACQGDILHWQNAIAQTPFHSTCGGKTENAEFCWSKAIPYLVAVDCHYCGASPRYSGHKRFSLSEAASLLNLPVDSLYAINVETYTPGDRINTLSIGDRQYQGTELRSLFGLNSAAFDWLIIGDYLVFSTVGFGHGVGLCQYGANGMAKRGYDYQEILYHYYPGTSIVKSHVLAEELSSN